jgi:hypothetical protein
MWEEVYEMTDTVRLSYLLNHCLGFLPTRDQYEEIRALGNEIAKENEQLRAENEGLRARLQDMEKDRDAWRSEWNMYAKAWSREIGNMVIPKTHLIDSLVLTTRQLYTESKRLKAAMKGIHQMAEEELKTLEVGSGSSLWQIEADARAALKEGDK